MSVAVQADVVPKLQDRDLKERRTSSQGKKEGEEEEEEKKGELQKRVEVAITAAHQLWKRQQEGKVRALLTQARKDWTEQHRAERDVGGLYLLK